MTREEALAKARDAAGRAAVLAGHAENAAHSFDNHPKTPRLAAAGALWADTSRAYAALAAVLPETEDTDG